MKDKGRRRIRMLYLQTSRVPPPADASSDRFLLLSDHLEGEVLQPIWFSTPAKVEQAMGSGAWPHFRRGSFRYRWSLSTRSSGLLRRMSLRWFYLTEGLRAHREQPIDCVMAYSHNAAAICGVILKILTGARLVVEVITPPDRAFIHEKPRARFTDHLRKYYSDLSLHISLWACDCVHLLYPEQLDSYPLLDRVRRVVFHEYVPVAAVPPSVPESPPVVLFVGAPWYLKGVDLLVAAFLRLAPDFPEVQLRIMGHFPDREKLEALTAGSPRIKIVKPRSNPDTLAIIAEATVLVLPSRCEGMGRVLLEAMAAGVPVVGSAVGGIPTMVRNGENGLLFPPGDDRALEECLRRLLSDASLRARLGAHGRELANSRFSEREYVRSFVALIEAAVAR